MEKKSFNLEEVKNLLCIQAHPDDADIGAGGTVAKLTRRRCRVTYVSVMDDRVGTLDPILWPEKLAKIRVEEQERAAEILGVQRLIWLGYRDSELYPSLELRGKLIRIIREIRPDVLMTLDPWLPYEAHPDHRYAGMMAAEAALFSVFPHVNPEHLRDGLQAYALPYVCFFGTHKPNTFIDITDFMEIKLKAIIQHKTQFGDTFEELEKRLKYYCSKMGEEINVKYAEAFKVLTPGQMHGNPFASEM